MSIFYDTTKVSHPTERLANEITNDLLSHSLIALHDRERVRQLVRTLLDVDGDGEKASMGEVQSGSVPVPGSAFVDWWHLKGKFYDPDTEDVSWYDKRRALAELAFDAAMAQSGNYVANRDTCPTRVQFTNGRIVRIEGDYLEVEMQNNQAE